MISQEQLVRKAASLCYLLSNEGTVSLVGFGRGSHHVNAILLLLCAFYIELKH